MRGLKLYTGNRLESLAQKLAELLTIPLSSPLTPEVIIVQSKGMERWVSMELAQHQGICANGRFPFPNAFVEEVFRKVLPDLPEPSPFTPRLMTWSIMKNLSSCLDKPGFESIRGYFAGAQPGLKRLQLSTQIADLFDQYLLFRPEMILAWEQGQETHWQAQLWRILSEGHEREHRASLGRMILEAVEQPDTPIEDLPERVSVFGISALPHFHMQLFAALSRWTEINLFLMNPCAAYWGDIVSGWEMKKSIVRESSPDLVLEQLHLEKGNSLLASMGRLGRDFFDSLTTLGCEETPLFEDPGEDRLLTCIQSDILYLRERPGPSEAKKLLIPDETSIQIHSCHGPMREVEVLYDRLLHMFERDPSLRPRDILVMTPDIEVYAPYIQAVFDVPEDPVKKIPFSISDRNVRRESQIVDTFMAVLDLHGSRFGAAQVLAVLESRAVERRFALMEADLEKIRRWVKDTRIRWGIDGRDRAQMGLPPFEENTWRAGLGRLLLGYAMPGQDEHMFAGVLPYDHLEGGDAEVLGRFIEFTDRLFAHVTSLSEARTLHAWSLSLTALLDDLFVPDEEEERDIQMLRRHLQALADMQNLSGFDEKLDPSVIRWHLGQCLVKEGFGFGFLSGGVTFCAMLPMRSIPCKVLCLLGMNHDTYPRESKTLGFDIMAKQPKAGDRSRRNDDRYLFLEAILSARETLYISYVGQSLMDNSPVPPSVLVSELMDYIEQGFGIQGQPILDHLLTSHRLQAFSPEYFKGPGKLFSFSEVNCRAAQSLLEIRAAPEPFISRGLPAPEEEWKAVDLENLCRFYANPTRFLLNRRLGIFLEEADRMVAEKEAFAIEGLEKYGIEQKLLRRKMAGGDLKAFLPSVRAAGLLPHGTVGECLYDQLRLGVERFVAKTEPYLHERPPAFVDVNLSLSDFRLTGRIDAIYPERLIHYRYARVKARDHLRLWIYHLALNSLEATSSTRRSMLVSLRPRGNESVWGAWEYPSVKNSPELLLRLLETYWDGLIKPLPFFPRSSYEYARLTLLEHSPEEALRKAADTWNGNDYHRGEKEDPYYQLCFQNTDPLGSEFQRIALDLFEPLLTHQIEIEP